MGIKGLWQLLLPTGRRVSIETLTGKRLAVDASIWLTQFLKANRDPETGAVRANAHLIGFLRRLARMLFNGIRPVLVFDGATPEIKLREIRARRERRERLNNFKGDDDNEGVKRLARRLLIANLKKQKELEKAQEKMEEGKKVKNPMEVIRSATAKGAKNTGAFASGFNLPEEEDEENTRTANEENSKDANGANGSERLENNPTSVLQEESDTEVEFVSASINQKANIEKGDQADEVLVLSDSEDYLQSLSKKQQNENNDWDKALEAAESDSENSEEESAEIPSDERELDIATISQLPSKTRVDIIEKVRRQQRMNSRREFMSVAANPMSYSQCQLKNFLKSADLNRKVKKLGKAAAQKCEDGMEGERIASDGSKRFIFTKDTDKDDEPLDRDDAENGSNGKMNLSLKKSGFMNSGAGLKSAPASEKRITQTSGVYGDDHDDGFSSDEGGFIKESCSDNTEELEIINQNQSKTKHYIIELGSSDESGKMLDSDDDDSIVEELDDDAGEGVSFDGDGSDGGGGFILNQENPEGNELPNRAIRDENVDSDDSSGGGGFILNQENLEGNELPNHAILDETVGSDDSDEGGGFMLNQANPEDNERPKHSIRDETVASDDSEESIVWEDGDVGGDVDRFTINTEGEKGSLAFADGNELINTTSDSHQKKRKLPIALDNEGRTRDSIGVTSLSNVKRKISVLNVEVEMEKSNQKSFDRSQKHDTPKYDTGRDVIEITSDNESSKTSHTKDSRDMAYNTYKRKNELAHHRSAQGPNDSTHIIELKEKDACFDDDIDDDIDWEDGDSVKLEQSHDDKEALLITNDNNSEASGGNIINLESIDSDLDPEIDKQDSNNTNFANEAALESAQATAAHLTDWAGRAVQRAIQAHLKENGSKPDSLSTKGQDRESSDDEMVESCNMEVEETPSVVYNSQPQEEVEHGIKEIDGTTATTIDTSLDGLIREEASLREEENRRERDMDTVTDEMVEEVMQLLELFGVPYLRAPAEAEAQCVELEKLGLVDGVVTEDSDAIVFGSNSVYRNIFHDKKYVEAYLSADSKAIGLGLNEKIALAMLLGGDYTEGVKGVGIVNGMEILKAFPVTSSVSDGLSSFRKWLDGFEFQDDDIDTNANLQEFRRKHKTARSRWVVPKDFPAQNVLHAYSKPVVDSSQANFSWGIPDIEALRVFCLKKMGWEVSETDRAIIPVLNEMNKGTRQTRVDSYFMRLEDNIKFADIKSKRLKEVWNMKKGDSEKTYEDILES